MCKTQHMQTAWGFYQTKGIAGSNAHVYHLRVLDQEIKATKNHIKIQQFIAPVVLQTGGDRRWPTDC